MGEGIAVSNRNGVQATKIVVNSPFPFLFGEPSELNLAHGHFDDLIKPCCNYDFNSFLATRSFVKYFVIVYDKPKCWKRFLIPMSYQMLKRPLCIV